jgi:hypothetical protein
MFVVTHPPLRLSLSLPHGCHVLQRQGVFSSSFLVFSSDRNNNKRSSSKRYSRAQRRRHAGQTEEEANLSASLRCPG